MAAGDVDADLSGNVIIDSMDDFDLDLIMNDRENFARQCRKMVGNGIRTRRAEVYY